MKRTLKMMTLFLMVSMVSFVFAQEKEADDSRMGGKSKTGLTKDADRIGKGVNKDGVTPSGGKKPPAPARLDSHEKGGSGVVKGAAGDAKGKFSLFKPSTWGKKKVKKESDPVTKN